MAKGLSRIVIILQLHSQGSSYISFMMHCDFYTESLKKKIQSTLMGGGVEKTYSGLLTIVDDP